MIEGSSTRCCTCSEASRRFVGHSCVSLQLVCHQQASVERLLLLSRHVHQHILVHADTHPAPVPNPGTAAAGATHWQCSTQ